MKKLGPISFYLLISYTFFSIYILNNDKDFYSFSLIINGVALIIIFTFFLIKYFFEKNNISYLHLFLLFLLIFFSLINSIYLEKINLHFVFVFILLLFVNEAPSKINKKIKNTIIFFCSLSIIYQLYNFRFLEITPTLSWKDPNYSGFFLFLFFLFLRGVGNKYLSYLFLILGFLTISRSYILAVLILFFFEKINAIRSFFNLLKINNFFYSLFLSFLGLLVLGNIISNQEEHTIEYSVSSKLSTLNDSSNHHRFRANEEFYKDLLKNPEHYFFGYNKEKYIENVYINTPHNAFLITVINYGLLFSFFYIILCGIIFNKILSESNSPAFFAIFSYYCFLGAGFHGFPFVLTIITLYFYGKNQNFARNK